MTASIARWRQRRRARRQREAPKDPNGDGRVGDRQEDFHPPATFRAVERVDLEDALKEFGPGNAMAQIEFLFSQWRGRRGPSRIAPVRRIFVRDDRSGFNGHFDR